MLNLGASSIMLELISQGKNSVISQIYMLNSNDIGIWIELRTMKVGRDPSILVKQL
jgi:hypothetical protein